MKQLKELGYIKVVQERNEAGRFSKNVYTLMQEIPVTTSASYKEQKPTTQASAPCREREKPNAKSPNTEKPNTHIFKKNHLKDTSISVNNYHVKSIIQMEETHKIKGFRGEFQ